MIKRQNLPIIFYDIWINHVLLIKTHAHELSCLSSYIAIVYAFQEYMSVGKYVQETGKYVQETYFPRKFCPTGQIYLGKNVRPDRNTSRGP